MSSLSSELRANVGCTFMADTTRQESWPPISDEDFIRGEEFGTLLIEAGELLTSKYAVMDFTDAVARTFVWFDLQVKKDPEFLRRRFKNKSECKAYVGACLFNYARQARRQETLSRRRLEYNVLESAEKDESFADRQMLWDAIYTLSERMREIVVALVVDKISIRMTAQRLGISRSLVSKEYMAAIDKLRKNLREPSHTGD